jgi:hypothetical protein
MSATVSSFTVDPASTAWTLGAEGIFPSQTLLVRASGYAQWAIAPKYSLVEGAYAAEGFPQTHVLDMHVIGKAGPLAPVTNVPGLSMAILAVPIGVVPGPLTPGAGRGDALVPRWTVDVDGVTRVALFYPSDMANMTRTTGPWDVYFGYNDGAYDDNSGSFSVTTIVTDIDNQPGGLLALPGHVTQDDIDTAEFCSFSGLLTPGNRLRSADERLLADIFAPYKQSGTKEF